MGVLESPGKVLDFLVSKRVGTLVSLNCAVCALELNTVLEQNLNALELTLSVIQLNHCVLVPKLCFRAKSLCDKERQLSCLLLSCCQ